MDLNVERVCVQLQDREQRGLLKYGVNTERNDLSTLEWLQHLQEELMDGCVYIEKLKGELNGNKKK
tara:strand:+ start:338 stop:535 length:198 start_codon:yes stop_codon:yes gene_type:complete